MKRIIVLSIFLTALYSLFAQTITYEDIKRNPISVIQQYQNTGIHSYQTMGGKVFHVGDALIIGKPSQGDLFSPLYAYINGPKSFHSGKSPIERGIIQKFYLKQVRNKSERNWVMCANIQSEQIVLSVQIENALKTMEIIGKDEAFSAPIPIQNRVENNIQSSPKREKEVKHQKPIKEKRNLSALKRKDEPQRKGYGGTAYISGGYDSVNSSVYIYANIINGYYFNSHIFAGVGVGIMYYGHSSYYYDWGYEYECNDAIIGMPIFIYGEYTFCHSQKKVRPYVSLGLGANIAFTSINNYYGYYAPHAFYIEAAGSIKVKLKDKLGLDIALTFPQSITESSGIGLRIGCSF